MEKIYTEKDINNYKIKMNMLEKNNETFANALTLLMVGESNFCFLSENMIGIKQKNIYEYKEFYKKFLIDYRKNIIVNYNIDLKNRKIKW